MVNVNGVAHTRQSGRRSTAAIDLGAYDDVTWPLGITRRSDPDFETRAGIWATIAATRGHQMVADGVISEGERRAAEVEYRAWLGQAGRSHVQYLLAVEGVRP